MVVSCPFYDNWKTPSPSHVVLDRVALQNAAGIPTVLSLHPLPHENAAL